MKHSIDIDQMVAAAPVKEKPDKERIAELEAEIKALKARTVAVETKQAENTAKIKAVEAKVTKEAAK